MEDDNSPSVDLVYVPHIKEEVVSDNEDGTGDEGWIPCDSEQTLLERIKAEEQWRTDQYYEKRDGDKKSDLHGKEEHKAENRETFVSLEEDQSHQINKVCSNTCNFSIVDGTEKRNCTSRVMHHLEEDVNRDNRDRSLTLGLGLSNGIQGLIAAGDETDKKWNRAPQKGRKSLITSKKSATANGITIKTECKVSSNNGLMIYHCEKCTKYFTSKKLFAMHADSHIQSGDTPNSPCRRRTSESSLRKHPKENVGGIKIRPVANEGYESKSAREIEDASDIRKRLGLRLRRRVTAKFWNRDDIEDSIKTDEEEQVDFSEGSDINDQSFTVHSKEGNGRKRISRKRSERMKRVARKCSDAESTLYRNGRERSVCPQCSHVFMKKTDLQRHLRVHTGEKPYACEICKARFTRNFGLQCHLRSHTGVKLHTCKTCGKSYSRRYDLVKHEKRVHTRECTYICSQCGKMFVTAQLLRVHERTHTNSQPYVCQECGHRSNHRSDLKKHLRVHTDERPYCCQICRETFRQKGTLTSHVRNNHGKAKGL